MVVAYNRKNDQEDVIMFEHDSFYVIQQRNDFSPISEEVVRKNDESDVYDRAEEIFNAMGV